MVEQIRMGALWCPHCNRMHPTSEPCTCEGAKAYSAMVIRDQLASAQSTRPPADEALRIAVEALEKIAARTKRHPDDTLDDDQRDKFHAHAQAIAALAKIKELGK